MFTHARSAARTGQGTEVNARAFSFEKTTAAATVNLLTVEPGLEKYPVRVNVEVCVKDALTGGAPSLVVQGVSEDGATTTTIATGTFAAGDTVKGSYLAYGRDKIQVVFSPGTTTGRGAVFAQLSGVGQLVG